VLVINTISWRTIEYAQMRIEPAMLKYQKLMGMMLFFCFSDAYHWTTNRRKKINCAKNPNSVQRSNFIPSSEISTFALYAFRNLNILPLYNIFYNQVVHRIDRQNEKHVEILLPGILFYDFRNRIILRFMPLFMNNQLTKKSCRYHLHSEQHK
jgi:hypothetical protein